MTTNRPLHASAKHEEITLAASPKLTIQAAADESKLPTFTLLAYTGGPMQLSRWADPVVVDLAGEITQRTPQLPLLYGHQRSDPVGHIDQFDVTDEGMTASGVMSVPGPSFDKITGAARNGYQWGASIGGVPSRVEYVEKGKTVQVNGQTYQGPLEVIRAIEIHEISVVSIAADRNATSNIAADAAEGEAMTFDQWLAAEHGINDASKVTPAKLKKLQAEFASVQAKADDDGNDDDAGKAQPKPAKDTPKPVEADAADAGIQASRERFAVEAERVDAIREVCAKLGDSSLQARAIREGWTADQTELEIRRARETVSAQAPMGFVPSGIQVTAQSVAAAAGLVAGGLTIRGVEASEGEQVAEAADSLRNRISGLQDLIEVAASVAGVELPRASRKSDDWIGAAFASHELTNVLSVAATKVLLNAYRQIDPTWEKVAHIETANNFHPSKAIDLSGDGAWPKIGDTGEVPLAKLSDEGYELQPYTYGRVFKVTRQQVINDDINAFLRMPQIIGRTGAMTILRAVWKLVMDNTGSFFDANSNNLRTGAAGALDIDTLSTGRSAMRSQLDPSGEVAGIEPKMLVVPPALESTARTLYTSEYVVQSGGSTKNTRPANNEHRGMYEPVVVPHLANSNISSGASSTAWYLFADPMDAAAVRVGFVGGRREPQVRGGQPLPVGELGVAWEAVLDFGVGFGNPRAAYKADGTD